MMRREPSLGRLVRRGLVALAAVLAIALVAEPAFAQRGTGRMQGRVLDAQGNPVAGVEITAFNPDVTPSTLTGDTDEGGRWAVIGMARGDYKFTFKKEGYISFEVDVTVSAANRNPDLNVTLNPIPEGAGASVVGADSESPELFNEGVTLFEAGDYTGAIAKWNEFLTLNPALYQVHGNLGNAYRELGDTDNARIAYQAMLAEEPSNDMANYNLGEMLVEAGQIQEAMPYFEKVLESAPDDPAVYYNVAELYFSEGQMEPAIQYYKRAIEVEPNYLSAHMQLGFAHLNNDDIPAAIAAFEKYIEIAPADDPQLPLVKDVLAAIKSG
ncbi:MAG TPA: tetratricopeptide repeat protein [Acidobacteriota bacterium]